MAEHLTEHLRRTESAIAHSADLPQSLVHPCHCAKEGLEVDNIAVPTCSTAFGTTISGPSPKNRLAIS